MVVEMVRVLVEQTRHHLRRRRQGRRSVARQRRHPKTRRWMSGTNLQMPAKCRQSFFIPASGAKQTAETIKGVGMGRFETGDVLVGFDGGGGTVGQGQGLRVAEEDGYADWVLGTRMVQGIQRGGKVAETQTCHSETVTKGGASRVARYGALEQGHGLRSRSGGHRVGGHEFRRLADAFGRRGCLWNVHLNQKRTQLLIREAMRWIQFQSSSIFLLSFGQTKLLVQFTCFLI
mmetsp:Transcript_34615/g.62355  ORF Transcript_34615/g.62355 Transcript_34615/m.62355 type:complete len:232 (-) Transcript_34615:173-868(-)